MTTRPKLPTTYSASIRMPGGRIEKRFVTTGKQRVETVNDAGEPVITIRRDDLGFIRVMQPAEMIYFEQKTTEIDEAMKVLFPPLDLAWQEETPVVIAGVPCRHFKGIGTSRHGATEEHVYVDPDGMFRRETSRIKGVELAMDYVEVSLADIPDAIFEFSTEGYKRRG